MWHQAQSEDGVEDCAVYSHPRSLARYKIAFMSLTCFFSIMIPLILPEVGEKKNAASVQGQNFFFFFWSKVDSF